MESDDAYNFYDPHAPVSHLSGNLPHWRQEAVTYFVTFRLADSIPNPVLAGWTHERELWLKRNPEPHTPAQRREYFDHFVLRFHKYLDAGHGSCILAQQEIKEMVTDALVYFDGERYRVDEHIVMPNHVHVLVTPLPGYELHSIEHTWKSYTSHRINKMTHRRGTNWQKESFDHIVRNPEQLVRIREYIRLNPQLAGLDVRGGGQSVGRV